MRCSWLLLLLFTTILCLTQAQRCRSDCGYKQCCGPRNCCRGSSGKQYNRPSSGGGKRPQKGGSGGGGGGGSGGGSGGGGSDYHW